MLNHRPHDLFAGRIPKRMDDALMGMPPLATKNQRSIELVEASPPSDQLSDPLGGFSHHHLDSP